MATRRVCAVPSPTAATSRNYILGHNKVQRVGHVMWSVRLGQRHASAAAAAAQRTALRAKPAMSGLQPFSQKSHTPTVAKEFQIGLYDPTEADLEHFWNCCSEGFLGERLYIVKFSIGHATWRPPRGRLTSSLEMEDIRNRLTHE